MVQTKQHSFPSTDGTVDIEAYLAEIAEKNPKLNLTLLRQAVVLAGLAGEEHATPYADSSFLHGIVMGHILSELNVDSETLAAAIIYSCVKYAGLSLDDVSEHLGENIAKLIQGTNEMDSISEFYPLLGRHNHQHPKIDNIRKMLLAMVDDIRVVLIKLAERLCALRKASILHEHKKRELAQETQAIYAPLANRLGIAHIKWELEDLSFRYLEPEKYKDISKSLNQKRTDREKFVHTMVDKLKRILADEKITKHQVYGRAKHIYSIYRKMQRKDVDISEIYDATAVRILLPTVEDCYTALSAVHAKWQHIPKEFDDYVTSPKPNGYRSIHTAVIGPNNRHVEIQIRTFSMHEEAELGVAAHWMYKEGRPKQADYETKIAWLRQVMDWQQEVTMSEDSLSEIKHIFEDRVYVFTPKGEVIDLPAGATPLDFAYHIHSEVGHRCRGAKINGKIVNLTYQLKTGEHVEVLTTKKGTPSRDWLNSHLGFLKTARAKAKVHHWFKQQNYQANVTQGQDLFEKEMRRIGLKNVDQAAIIKKLHFKTNEDMFAALGCGDLKLTVIVNTIQNNINQQTETILEPVHPAKVTTKPTDIEVLGVGNLLTHVAACCKPVPGDAIIGYITQGKGVSIHRADCPNIAYAQKNKPERLLEVSWGEKTKQTYPVDLSIIAYDRHGLIRDISNIIAGENLMLVGINTNSDNKENLEHINLTVQISSLDALSKICAKINQLNNIIEVKRQS